GYAPPPGYGSPGYAHPGGQPPYGAPAPTPAPAAAAWAPPYAHPAARTPRTSLDATTPARPTSPVGTIALVAGLLAAVVAPIAASVASWQIGVGVGAEQASRPASTQFDPLVFVPVRDWVLLGEVSFWLGTLFGVWALVQGIVAIAKKRGRGAGIAAGAGVS